MTEDDVLASRREQWDGGVDATRAVTAYLDEMEGRSSYDDVVHGMNDIELRRSHLRALLAENERLRGELIETERDLDSVQLNLRQTIHALRGERNGLAALVEKAPHGPDCITDWGDDPCDCWKSAAPADVLADTIRPESILFCSACGDEEWRACSCGDDYVEGVDRA